MSGTVIVGIGNILLGDDGVGIHVLRRLQSLKLPADVTCVESGTGTLQALEPMLAADHVVIIDAAMDGSPAGTIRRLAGRDLLPRSHGLTVHDLGLLELLATCRLQGCFPRITVFAISIDEAANFTNQLSPQIRNAVPQVIDRVLHELLGIPKRAVDSQHPRDDQPSTC